MASPDAAPTEPERWRDLDMLLSRPGNLVEASFEPSSTLRDMLGSIVEVLVVGAGGLGCELLKDLALSGFRNLHVIDMDTIDVSNLNRQFLFRVQDVGKSKAEVAAQRVMERVSGVNIVPHFCRIEDKELEFYSQFHIIVLGVDSIEARSYINSVACGFLGRSAFPTAIARSSSGSLSLREAVLVPAGPGRIPSRSSKYPSCRGSSERREMTQKQGLFKGKSKKKSVPPNRHGKAPHVRKGKRVVKPNKFTEDMGAEKELTKFINHCNEIKAANIASKEGGDLNIVKPDGDQSKK